MVRPVPFPHPVTGALFDSPVPPGTGWPDDPASPGTPVARAVCSRASKRPISSGSTATTSLPQASYAIACSAQKSRSRSRPRAQSSALRLPGL